MGPHRVRLGLMPITRGGQEELGVAREMEAWRFAKTLGPGSGAERRRSAGLDADLLAI